MTESLLERSAEETERPTNSEFCQSYLLYSPDGLHWVKDKAHPFLSRHTDTKIALLRNSRTGRFQVRLNQAELFSIVGDFGLASLTEPPGMDYL